jgi:signal transduction histidine kinase
LELETAGDELRIEQVLANLLANAIKFTEEGHVILRASVDEDHQHLKISVIDTGIGIASDEITTLFKAFQQIDSTPTRHYGGVGLGLSICRHITTLMGESVAVTSQPGEGSAVYAWKTTVSESGRCGQVSLGPYCYWQPVASQRLSY